MKTIEIIVSSIGDTQIQTKGFHGSECREASKAIEQALGIRHAERLTAEFHQTSGINAQIREGQA